jgi:hypothetical protein
MMDTPYTDHLGTFFLAIHFAGLIALAVVLAATMWSIP